MTASNILCRLATSTAVALAFCRIAHADDSLALHPLQTSNVRIHFMVDLYRAIEQATLNATGSQIDSNLASGSAGSLVKKFEAALAKPLDRPQMIWSVVAADIGGRSVPAGTIVVGAVVPPKMLYPTAATQNDARFAGHPVFCAYKDDLVIAKGTINAFDGTVTIDSSPNTAPDTGKSVCQPYLLARGNSMMAQSKPAPGTPPASAPR